MIQTPDHKFALRLSDVSFGYSQSQPLFSGVSLQVGLGEFVSVVGMSGSGKSTLLKLAGGLLAPGSGAVETCGIVRTVFQHGNLFPWFSVLTNVKLGALSTGEPRAVVRQRAIHLLAELGLEDKAKRSIFSLSGGEQQRVAIARAFVANPALVLMDEPFSALDEMRRRRAQKLLLKFRADKNAGVLFVTHHIEEAILLGDRVAVLNRAGALTEYQVPFGRSRPPEIVFEKGFVELRRAIDENFLI